MNFLIDSSLSPTVAETLRQAGHDAVHVRHYGIHKAEDEIVFDRAAEEDRVGVSADTRFATVLSLRHAFKPSVIVFRRVSPRRTEALANLLSQTYLTSLLCSTSAVSSFSKKHGCAVVRLGHYP